MIHQYEFITAWGSRRQLVVFPKGSNIPAMYNAGDFEDVQTRREAAWLLRMVRNHPHWKIKRVV